MKQLILFSHIFLLFFFFIGNNIGYTQKTIDLEGVLMDTNNDTVPFASVSFLNKKTGTSSTEDGEFSLVVTEKDYSDTILVNCLGFKTVSIKVVDFLNQEKKVIILEENIATLDTVEILSSGTIAEKVFQNLKETTISEKHQINGIYRVTEAEFGKSKLFTEYYVKVLDKGLSYPRFLKFEFPERRRSSDYRFFKTKEIITFNNISQFNPIRALWVNEKNKWKKMGNTTYGDEDVIILGTKTKNGKPIKIYVGLDDYGIYRIELWGALYIYKKDANGKLYLSYHNRNRNIKNKVKSPQLIKHLQSLGYANAKIIKSAIKYEFITLNIETNKKKFSIKGKAIPRKENGDLDIKYNPSFWLNLKMPPETKLLKKVKKDLVSHYNVPFETQLRNSK